MTDSDSSPLACDAGLGTSGLNCPLSLLRTRLELNRPPSGRVLKVIITDAGSQQDFRVFARLVGHELLRERTAEGVYRYWLRRRQRSLRRPGSGFPTIKALRDWTQHCFPDEEVVALAIMSVFGFNVILALGGMLTPILAAMMIAFLIQGVIDILERFRVPHLFAIRLAYSLFLGLLALFPVVLLPLFWQQLFTLFNELPRILDEWQSMLLTLLERYPSLISEEQALEVIETARSESGQIDRWTLTSSLANPPVVVNVMIYPVLVPILVFLSLKDKKCFYTWFRRYLPCECRLMEQVRAEMNQQIANYIRSKVVEIVIADAVTYIVFAYPGFNYVALLALLVDLLMAVPYIGTVVVSVPVAMITSFQQGWSDQLIYLMAVHAIIQALDGSVLVSLLFSKAVNLHSVVIIRAVLLFSGFWGFWGVFFAIPLATLVRAVLDAQPKDLPETPAAA